MLRVLVMDCECAAGVESVQSLGRFGVEVHASSRNRDALGFTSKYCRQRLLQPIDPSEFGAWLLALDREHNYILLVPSTEISLAALEAAVLPESIRSKAVLPSSAAISTALDKEQVWQLASQLEIPVPRSILQNGITGQAPFPFPIVVKPVQSKKIERGIVKDFRVSILRTQKDWDDFAEQNPSGIFQVQEYFTGHGVGIELLFAYGQPVWHFAHERLHEYPLTGGGSSYRRSIASPPALLEHSICLLRALDWHGVAMVEWKINDRGECSLMEINPRLWGSLALAIDAGVNFPVGLLKVAQK
jgi:predicted ATP-grasp superfamily ATP-dependent carboligase